MKEVEIWRNKYNLTTVEKYGVSKCKIKIETDIENLLNKIYV